MKTLKNISIVSLIVIALLSLSNTAFAQLKYAKGYIIVLKGDTLKGEIEINPKKELDAFRKIKFRANAGTPLKMYNPERLKGYGIDTTAFISSLIDDENVFIKRIVSGTYNLYEARTEVEEGKDVTFEPDYFYMKGKETILIQDKPTKFKKQMIALMSDNNKIVKALEEEEFNYSSVIKLFQTYNK